MNWKQGKYPNVWRAGPYKVVHYLYAWRPTFDGRELIDSPNYRAYYMKNRQSHQVDPAVKSYETFEQAEAACEKHANALA